MNNQELKSLLINKIKELGKTPRELEIDGSIYFWSGGQRIGNSTLYRYRENTLNNPKEKQIMLPC